MITFRKATEKDLDAIEAIYHDIHSLEEAGKTVIGWVRGIYPTRKTAEAALLRDDLFVMEDSGILVGSAIINQKQVEEYRFGEWTTNPPEEKIMVLHTLVIAPEAGRKGYGKQFVAFYETYAQEHKCPYLRMDTNERNSRARAMYRKLGYREVGIVPCDFNGIQSINLVLLEKNMDEK